MRGFLLGRGAYVGVGSGGYWGILGLELSGICGARVWGETGGDLGLICLVYVGVGAGGPLNLDHPWRGGGVRALPYITEPERNVTKLRGNMFAAMSELLIFSAAMSELLIF